MSLEARGKFGNIAVANLTRGIQILKKKKDPTNPKTPGQKKQRQVYSDGRLFYKSLRLTERDKTSLSRLSRLLKFKLNPFQFFMTSYFAAREVVVIVEFASQVISNSPSSGKLYVYCEAPTGLNMLVYINRRFNQNWTRYPIFEIPGQGKYRTTIADLISREKYYFIFASINIWGEEETLSGLYFERTK